MATRGVFLFLLLLLLSGTAFSFPGDNLHLEGQESSATSFDLEEDAPDLYEGTVPFFKTNVFNAFLLTAGSNFLFQNYYETQLQTDYIRRSEQIIPGLDVPDIIFPFHGFL